MRSYPTESPMVLTDGHGQGGSCQVLRTFFVGSVQLRISFCLQEMFLFELLLPKFHFSGHTNQVVAVTFWIKCWYLWLQHLNPEKPFLFPSRCHFDLCFGFGSSVWLWSPIHSSR